jgi:phosphatidylinositol-3-phosphatase
MLGVRRGGRRQLPGGARLPLAVALVAVLVAVLAACGPAASAPTPSGTPATTAGTNASTLGATSTGGGPTASSTARVLQRRKVMVIAEENHTFEEVFGSGRAPYLTGLARTYATFTAVDAGYPTSCPSLPGYLLMTSGSTHGVCDDAGPDAHKLGGPSIFSEVQDAGLQWRGYAESMPAPCTATDAVDGRYLVRHAPAPYYTAIAARCRTWDLPLGTVAAGPLHDAVTAGRLPDYAFVTPDACDDMHGAPGCPGSLVGAADTWLAEWLPRILDGPDYRAGRLVVVLTWDEGSQDSNHIPTIVITPDGRGVSVNGPTTQCGLLALEQDVLQIPPLGCARPTSSTRNLEEVLGLDG